MKSNKVFLLLIFSLFLITFLFGLLLHINLDTSLDSWSLISVISAIGGVLIMYYTLTKEDFKNFIILYSGIWFVYILLVLYSIFFPLVTIKNHRFHIKALVDYFSSVTFIFTPLPFIFYWVFIKSFKSIKL